MRQISKTPKFERDFKRSVKKRRAIQELIKVVDLLQTTGVLPLKYKPHKLIGSWHPSIECHVNKDFLLIYEIYDKELLLIRLGTHDELF